MMELQTGLDVSQRPQLVLTERMQQSLHLLQTPGIELAELLREVLSGNPFLEEETTADTGPAEREETEAAGPPEGDRVPDLPKAPWGRESRHGFVSPTRAEEPWRTRLLRRFRIEHRVEADVVVADYILGSLDERGCVRAGVALGGAAAAGAAAVGWPSARAGLSDRMRPPTTR